MISLDGATAETHEKIRLGSKFDVTMANVENFLNEKARRGLSDPYTIVQMIYMPENEHEADMFYERWKPFPALDVIRPQALPVAAGGHPSSPTTPRKPWSPMRSCPASCLGGRLSIAWDGTLALCCADLNFKNSMGNVGDPHHRRPLEFREDGRLPGKLLSTGRKSEIDICKNCSTCKTNPVTRFGSVLLDNLSIRKFLPYVEKLTIKFGLKLGEY